MRWVGGVDTIGCAMTHRESNIDGRCSMIEIMITLRDRCALLMSG